MNNDLIARLRPLLNTAELELTAEGGVVAHRIPRWARDQISDPFLAMASSQPSGTIMRFVTDSSVVRLRVSSSAGQLIGLPAPTPTLVVRAGGTEEVRPLAAAISWMDPRTGTIEEGDAPPEEIVLRPTPGVPMSVLLPQDGMIEFMEVHAEHPLRPVNDSRPIWLHYGSSISHCANADSPATTWPMQIADRMEWNLLSLGLSGQAQLDPAVGRLISDTPADLITLKVGINIVGAGSMGVRTFRPAVEGFLDRIREGHPRTPILVISAVSCPMLEDATGPTSIAGSRFLVPPARHADPGALTLQKSREILAAVVQRRMREDPFLTYLDGRDLFGPDDAGLLPDDLHPNQEGMDLIAEKFTGLLAQGRLSHIKPRTPL